MIAKSIKGKSTLEIKAALEESMAETTLPDTQRYKPTLAVVFLSDVEEIDAICELFNAKNISLFGASTSEKFTEDGIEPDGIAVLLLDMVPTHFKIALNDFK